MICPSCERDVNPVGILGDDMQVISRCPDESCNARMGVTATPESPQRQTIRPVTASPPPTNILDMAKSRLAVVDAEIAKLRSLEQEQVMLRRMIAAAEGTKKN